VHPWALGIGNGVRPPTGAPSCSRRRCCAPATSTPSPPVPTAPAGPGERSGSAPRGSPSGWCYGTAAGLRAVAAQVIGGHGHSEEDLRYVRRRYLTLEAAREIAVAIADPTFAARRSGPAPPPRLRRWSRTRCATAPR
jgi:hypothetical protein